MYMIMKRHPGDDIPLSDVVLTAIEAINNKRVNPTTLSSHTGESQLMDGCALAAVPMLYTCRQWARVGVGAR